MVSQANILFTMPHERRSALIEPRGHPRPTFKRKVALAIPTLCEASNIPPLLERVRAVLDPLGFDYEILVVDDDSCDGTAEAVSTIARQDPRVRLLVRKGRRGLSGAVLHGWENTDASIVGVMDADLQHPPELLPELTAAMFSGCDLVIGSRYAPGGGLGQWNPLRKLLSAAAVWATWPVQRVGLGLRAKDPMSGFFFVRRECLVGVPFQQSGFKLLLEILVRARISSVREIPFEFGRRYRGTSKANMKVAIDYGCLLSRLYRSKFGFRREVPVSSFD
jgi:dolichol-phosphate mannosyltransferase